MADAGGTVWHTTSVEDWNTGVDIVVKSPHFESVIAVFIFGNCAVMGIQAQLVLDRKDSLAIDVFEQIFTAVFVAELIFRIYAMGWRKFVPCCRKKRHKGSWWNMADALVVIVTGVIPSWILPLVGSGGLDILRVLTVLRTLRLIRVFRVLRTEFFKDVCTLLRGMVDSMRMLFWTCLVIAVLTYIFAIFGVVLISPVLRDAYEEALVSSSSSEDDILELEQLAEMFGGMTQFMLTLTQVLTLDSWTGFVRIVLKYCPTAWIFFYAYVALAVLVLMNIVTAVLVDKALTNSQKDADEVIAQKQIDKENSLKHFRTVFQALDTDGSGSLTHEEFSAGCLNEEVGKHLLALEIEPANCEEIFQLLDTGDGILTLDEFFDGLQRMEGMATAKDMFRLRQTTEHILKSLHTGSSGDGRVTCCCQAADNAKLADFGPSDDAISRRLDAVLAALVANNAALVATNEKVDACTRQVNILTERDSWAI